VESEKQRADREAAVKRTVEFQKARAEAGSETAQYDLGVRYMKGDGVKRDFVLARTWLEASAKQGNSGAAKKLEELKALESKADGGEGGAEKVAPQDPSKPSDKPAVSHEPPAAKK
jgi:TPR repeat protein